MMAGRPESCHLPRKEDTRIWENFVSFKRTDVFMWMLSCVDDKLSVKYFLLDIPRANVPVLMKMVTSGWMAHFCVNAELIIVCIQICNLRRSGNCLMRSWKKQRNSHSYLRATRRGAARRDWMSLAHSTGKFVFSWAMGCLNWLLAVEKIQNQILCFFLVFFISEKERFGAGMKNDSERKFRKSVFWKTYQKP